MVGFGCIFFLGLLVVPVKRELAGVGTSRRFTIGRSHFGTMDAEEMRQLKTLQQENTGLKRLLAERDLEIDVIAGDVREIFDEFVKRNDDLTFVSHIPTTAAATGINL